MANLVEIIIRVDNAQGVQALNATKDAVKNLGAEGEVSFRQFSTGTDVTTAGLGRAGTAMRTMGGHATTSLDSVRLLSQEFGLRLPRALEAMLSRVPAVTSALNSFIGIAAGIAVAEVVVRAGVAVYNLEQKYISLAAAAKEYHDEVEKRRDEDFVNPQSIEDTTQRIREATAEAEKFSSVSQNLSKSGWDDILGRTNRWDPSAPIAGAISLYDAHTAAESANKKKEQADGLNVTRIGQQHDINGLLLDANHAVDGQLQGQQKINAELQKKLALHAEENRYTKERDSTLQLTGNSKSGDQKRALQDQIARGEAAAQTVALQREIRDKTISLQNEATNAGLQGGALLLAQRMQAEVTIRRSATGIQAEINAIETRYHQERIKRIQDETEAIEKRVRVESQAGLTGIAKIQGQGQGRIADVDDRERKGLYADQEKAGAPSALATKDRANVTTQMYREIADAEKAYDKQVQESNERTSAFMITGFAKVDHELEASVQKRVDAFTEMYDQLDHRSAQYLSAKGGLEQGNAGDYARAAQERSQLEDQIRERTLALDTEADQAERRIRGQGLNAWVENYRSSVVAIQAAREQLRTKIDREESQPGVTGAAHDQFERQKIDADRKANAQIVELNQGMRQQLANNLQSAFDDPVHYIQNRMKQMFFQMLADWLLQSEAFKGSFGKLMGGLHLGGTGSTSSALGVGGAAARVAGAGIPASAVGAPSGTTGTNGGSFTGGSGTLSQAMIAPGSGTAGMTPFGALSDASSLAGTGTAAIAALSGSSNDEANAAHEAGHSLGSDDAAASGAGLSSAMGVAAAGFGAYTGTRGVISAFESGKASGILSGATSGAELGASVGMLAGPLGSVVGAGIGAVGGAAAGLVGWASGEGNRIGAGKYYKSTILPGMIAAETGYVHGSGDAVTAISAVNSAATGGYSEIMRQFGGSAAQWAKAAYIDKERNYLEGQINSMAKGGRDYMSASAAQFHSGGRIGGFGDLATGGNEGFIHALLGETVVNLVASSAHSPYLSAMNSGASEAEMAAMYLRAAGSSGSLGSGGGGDTHHHWNVNTMDSSSFRQYLRGGGSAVIEQEANKYVSRYAGDAASG